MLCSSRTIIILFLAFVAMQSIRNKFCRAREIISDDELQHLAIRYHHRHPNFTIDIQERTCQTIILACTYHYRHIEIDLRCECIYNNSSREFQSNWSTGNIQYRQILDDIFSHLNSSSKNRSLNDQIELTIENITRYFTKSKSIEEEQQSPVRTRNGSVSLPASIQILEYERSPRSQRRACLERSLSWSQSVQK